MKLSDELEKKLRFKTIERFGGKKGHSTKPSQSYEKWVVIRKIDALRNHIS